MTELLLGTTRLALSAAAGFLLANAALWPNLSEFTPLSLILLVASVLTCRPTTSVACGFTFGFTYWYSLLGWADRAGAAAVSGIHLAAFTVAMLEASFSAAWAYAVRGLRQTPMPVAAASAGALWSAEEAARTIGTWTMPYGEIGASQSSSMFAAILQVIGTPGLTTIIVAASYVVARVGLTLPGGRPHLSAIAAVCVAVGLATACLPRIPPNYGRSTTALIATVQARAHDERALETLLDEARFRLGPRSADAIIFPEGALDFQITRKDMVRINDWVRAARLPILAGALLRSPHRVANVVLLFDGSKFPREYVKQKLVPFGEFVPAKPLFSRIIHLPIGDFERGTKTTVWNLGRVRVSPLICFEIAFGALAARGVREGADAVVVSLNDAWFRDEAGTSLQYAVARARALSFGDDVVIVASRGSSAVFGADGSVIYRGSEYDPFVTLPISARHRTIYDLIGDEPLVVVTMMLCLYYAVLVIRRIRKRSMPDYAT